MKGFALTYVLCLVVLGALDFAWLSLTSASVYRPNMAGMLRDDPNMAAAVAFYVLYGFGLCFVIIRPALSDGRLSGAVLGGLALKAAIFGLVAFATYDLTGLSVIKNWSLKLSLIDMAWGTFAAMTTSVVVALLLKLFRQVS